MAVLRPGQTFKDYRLASLISRGGMGEVWRAWREGPDGFRRDVALKVILPNLAEQGRFIEMFLTEARIAARLDHPNIVPAIHCGKEGDMLYIEQAFVPGLDLRKLLTALGRPLPPELAVFVTVEILRALDYAHDGKDARGQKLNVIHRDVKPHNVLISYDGHVRLTDFGIAKARSEAQLSASSEIKGTAGYIAPEILAGYPASPRSDLFAVGLVFWETLTGGRLFEGDNEHVRLSKTIQCVVPPFAAIGLQVPPGVEDVMRTMLKREPDERYQSCGAALRALLGTPGAKNATAHDLRDYLVEVAGITQPPDPVDLDAGAVPEAVASSSIPVVPMVAPSFTPSPTTVVSSGTSRTPGYVGEAPPLTVSSPAPQHPLDRVFGSKLAVAGLSALAVAAVAAAVFVFAGPRRAVPAATPVAAPTAPVPVPVPSIDAAPPPAPVAVTPPPPVEPASPPDAGVVASEPKPTSSSSSSSGKKKRRPDAGVTNRPDYSGTILPE